MTGEGRTCIRGHVVAGENAIHHKDGYLRCKACEHTRRPGRPIRRNAANPWAGRRVCLSCGSADWTLPFNPEDPDTRWRCVQCSEWLPAEAKEIAA